MKKKGSITLMAMFLFSIILLGLGTSSNAAPIESFIIPPPEKEMGGDAS